MQEYMSISMLHTLYKDQARSMSVNADTAEAFAQWQQLAQAKLCELLALDKYESCDPLALVYEWMRVPGGYVRERAIIQTEPDVWMLFFVFYSESLATPAPAVIIIPPEAGGKFAVVYSDDYSAMAQLSGEARREVEQSWTQSMRLADNGFIVLAPDTRGVGERREWMDEGESKFMRSSHRAVQNVAIALGESLAGMTAWEMSRLLDYVDTRADYDGHAYIYGAKSAGMLALYCGAADKRFEGVGVLDGFGSYGEGLLRTGDACACSFVPSLWRWFEVCDVAAMVAPRRLYIGELGVNDMEIEHVYEVLGARESLFLFRKKK